jgi:V8-like Glu-specific endopeptidase
VIGLLIVSIILVIALVLSIVLVFTIGLKAAKGNNSQEENLPESPPFEPCACGCPSIEPIFTERTTATARIVNGETARPHSWPWQMLLMIVDEDQTPLFICGATLFTDRHILTAAHCVHQYVSPFIFLFSGQHTFNLSVSLRSGHQVNGIYIHEGYNAYYQNDIAILTIE